MLENLTLGSIIDFLTGLICYSIQNNLRTTVATIGQIEVDEIYVGINKRSTHFVIPWQAKSRSDSFGIVQVLQDVALCQVRYPSAICKPIAFQFTGADSVAVLELAVREESGILKLSTVDEKHYRLIPRSGF